MLCTVYVLYRDGQKLPKEEVRASPISGHLIVGQCPNRRYPMKVAQLLSLEDGQEFALPTLDSAVVVGIKRGGILITGNDAPSLGHFRLQRWWVVPHQVVTVAPAADA